MFAMKLKQFIIGIFLLFISCAAIEPTRVENGLYINPAYQFSLRIPTGWEASGSIPEVFKKNKSYFYNQKFKATFYDLDNQRFILVAAEKTDLDWVSFKMYSDKFIVSLDDFYAKEKEKFLEIPGSHYYLYEIYKDNIESCGGKCVATKIEFYFEDLKATGHNIAYKSKHGILYSASLILVTRESKHQSQIQILKHVKDSFQTL